MAGPRRRFESWEKFVAALDRSRGFRVVLRYSDRIGDSDLKRTRERLWFAHLKATGVLEQTPQPWESRAMATPGFRGTARELQALSNAILRIQDRVEKALGSRVGELNELAGIVGLEASRRRLERTHKEHWAKAKPKSAKIGGGKLDPGTTLLDELDRLLDPIPPGERRGAMSQLLVFAIGGRRLSAEAIRSRLKAYRERKSR